MFAKCPATWLCIVLLFHSTKINGKVIVGARAQASESQQLPDKSVSKRGIGHHINDFGPNTQVTSSVLQFQPHDAINSPHESISYPWQSIGLSPGYGAWLPTGYPAIYYGGFGQHVVDRHNLIPLTEHGSGYGGTGAGVDTDFVPPSALSPGLHTNVISAIATELPSKQFELLDEHNTKSYGK